MPFPASPLPVRVYLDPDGAPADPDSWVWTDVTDHVREGSKIGITVGRPDERGQVGPGRCSLHLDNRPSKGNGRYSSRNPRGQWYGRLGRNTPIRVAVRAAYDTFGRTVADGLGTAESGQTWTRKTGGATDFDVTPGTLTVTVPTANLFREAYLAGVRYADVNATATVQLGAADITGGAVYAWIVLRGTDFGQGFAMGLVVGASEAIDAQIYGRTGALLAGAATGITHSGQALRIRAEAVGTRLRLKAWAAAGTEPAAWTVTTDAPDTDPGEVGLSVNRSSGNTNASLTFAWSALTVEVDRFVGLVPEWSPRRDLSDRDRTAPIVASGILRRLAQGQAPAAPALRRAIGFHAPLAHWPLDDGEDARAAASLVPGVPALTRSGNIVFANGTPPAGATACVRADGVYDLAAGSLLSILRGSVGQVRPAPTGWTMLLWARQVAPWSAGQTLNSYGWVYEVGGLIWVWQINHQTQQLDCAWYTDPATYGGAVGSLTSIDMVGDWRQIALTVAQNGANIDAAIHITSSYDGAPVQTYTATSTVNGRTLTPPGRLELWTMGYNTTALPVAYLSSCAVLPTALTTGQLTALGEAGFGGSGQTAVERIAALCAQEDVPVHLPAVDRSSALGVQPAQQLLDLLREAERTDAGVLYERGGGLAYRPRADSYNAAADLTVAHGELAADADPTDDDQRLRNRITATRPDAEQVTVEDTALILAAGLYEDSVEVSLPDAGMLASHANWRLRAGTVEELRYPAISLDLAARPAHIDRWLGCHIGARLTLTGLPDDLPPDDVGLLLEGYTETLGAYTWDVDLTTSPATAYRVGVYDDPLLGRYDTGGSELASAATSSATSLSVLTTVLPVWTQAAAAFPFDLAVGGERITVTAIGAPASNVQTFTVTRAVNGISKAHAAGAPVSLWAPARRAL